MKRLRLPCVPFLDTTALEIYLSLKLIAWGVWLLLPFQAYTGGFVVLAGYLPEGWCGAIAATFGLARFASFRYRNYVRFTSGLAFVFWVGVAGGLAGANPRSPAIVTFSAHALAHLFVATRSRSLLYDRGGR